MKARLLGVAVLLALFCMNAEAVTWRFDFTSSHGGGFFEVDPTTYNVIAADITIDAGSGLAP